MKVPLSVSKSPTVGLQKSYSWSSKVPLLTFKSPTVEDQKCHFCRLPPSACHKKSGGDLSSRTCRHPINYIHSGSARHPHGHGATPFLTKGPACFPTRLGFAPRNACGAGPPNENKTTLCRLLHPANGARKQSCGACVLTEKAPQLLCLRGYSSSSSQKEPPRDKTSSPTPKSP